MKAPIITDQPTPPNNSQNASANLQKQELTLELRKFILLLASLVAMVTYAVGFCPPGDFLQDTATGHLAGEPIIRDTHYKRYVAFFYCNATTFAVSLVIIALILIIAYLDNKQQEKKHRITLRTLQVAMVLDLLSLMGAYAAGTCWDTFTNIYSSLMVGFVLAYLVIQMVVASCFTGSGSASVQERLHGKALASVPAKNADSGSGGVTTQIEEEKQRKVEERFRKIQMLLATFTVSITYLAGLSTPGGFWDTAGAGYHPGDHILKDRHGTRLAVFFCFNTTAFVASLLIIVVLLGTKLRKINAYGFMVVALFNLLVAYNAGRCRKAADTTVYVFSLIPAVLLYLSFLYMVKDHIHAKWEAMANLFRKKKHNEAVAEPDKDLKPKPELKPRDKEKAANKARSLVLLFVTLVVAITYQWGLYTPRGVWQPNTFGHMAGDPNPNLSRKKKHGKRRKNGSARS